MSNPHLGYTSAADGSPLYMAYYAPAAAGRGAPVLVCPPLFEERKSAYAGLRKLAARLAAGGHAVLCFDYRGSGESGGCSAARRWAHLAEDAATAREALRGLSGQNEALLLGLRLGATLALQQAAAASVKAVAALAPILSGASQVRQWKMRSKIRAELTEGAPAPSPLAPLPEGERGIDFDGYVIHPGFFEDVMALDLLKTAPLPCPALVVQISHRTEAAPESAQLIAALGGQAKLECLRLEPFWDKLDDVDTRRVEDIVYEWVSALQA